MIPRGNEYCSLLGRLVSALGLYPYQDNPLLRLRAMHGHLMELRVEDFPPDLREPWERVRTALHTHGPGLDRMTPDQAGRLLALVFYVQARLEAAAGIDD